MTMLRFVLLQVLIAVDQLANALAFGWADETISSRAWRLSASSRVWAAARAAIDAVFRVIAGQPDHCFDAYVSERLRSQLPPEMRSADTTTRNLLTK